MAVLYDVMDEPGITAASVFDPEGFGKLMKTVFRGAVHPCSAVHERKIAFPVIGMHVIFAETLTGLRKSEMCSECRIPVPVDQSIAVFFNVDLHDSKEGGEKVRHGFVDAVRSYGGISHHLVMKGLVVE